MCRLLPLGVLFHGTNVAFAPLFIETKNLTKGEIGV